MSPIGFNDVGLASVLIDDAIVRDGEKKEERPPMIAEAIKCVGGEAPSERLERRAIVSL
jgi:hypothetical protein